MTSTTKKKPTTAQTRSSNKSQRSKKLDRRTVNFATPPPPSSSKPLQTLSKPPVFSIGSSVLTLEKDEKKGKGKASDCLVPVVVGDASEGGSQLWVQLYEPTTEEDLAVHKRKVDDVRSWLNEAFDGGPNGKLKKYRRILVLTGPAGCAKTTTLHVLARELGAEILEWKNAFDDGFAGSGEDYSRESLNEKFHSFIKRAATCRALHLNSTHQSSPFSSSRSPTLPTATSIHSPKPPSQRRIILLEDLPNILHQPTQEAFHAALGTFASTPPSSGQDGVPLVMIISDAGVRSEDREDGRFGRSRGKEAVDVRTAVPPRLLHGPYVTQINFNPIAPTLMVRALQSLLTKHASLSTPLHGVRTPAKEELEMIVEASNGDIRSAVMSLQFACVYGSTAVAEKGGLEASGRKGKKRSGRNARAMLESVTRRENSLALFHMLGKVLYNKRKGDPPGQSATARDKQREQALDSQLKTPYPLPSWLKEHERKSSRVDVDALYADSPIDAGLFALYIHQNYTQYCNEVDECANLCDWLSWIDSSGGEHWYNANPHQFHLLTLGALHSLPTPVSRKGQKMYKPEYFDVLKKAKEAADAVDDAGEWLRGGCDHVVDADASGSTSFAGSSWTREEIAMEVGAVMKIKDMRDNATTSSRNTILPPASHHLFTTLLYTTESSGAGAESLNDRDDAAVEVLADEEESAIKRPVMKSQERGFGGFDENDDEGAAGGWLEEDDIEDD